MLKWVLLCSTKAASKLSFDENEMQILVDTNIQLGIATGTGIPLFQQKLLRFVLALDDSPSSNQNYTH